MEVKAVIGSLFGDEGKGTLVQYLCSEAINENKSVIVVRFSGGPQAAHTVEHNSINHICSSFGSGTLLGVDTAYVRGSYFDPICAFNESKTLRVKGVELPTIHLFDNGIITPYDVKSAHEDKKAEDDGSCKAGVWQAVQRQASGHTFKSYNLTHQDDNPDTLENLCNLYLDDARNYYGYSRNDELEKQFNAAMKHGCENYLKLYESMGEFKTLLQCYDVVIFEGTQGLLLDGTYGFYPHVTSTKVGIEPILDIVPKYLEGCGMSDVDFYFVTRTYLTRHGNGYNPRKKLEWDLSNKCETNTYNENQGKFKVGCLELELFERATDRHRLDNLQKKHGLKYHLAVTHMDLLKENGKCDMLYGLEHIITTGIEETMQMIGGWFSGVTFTDWLYSDSPEGEFKYADIDIF